MVYGKNDAVSHSSMSVIVKVPDVGYWPVLHSERLQIVTCNFAFITPAMATLFDCIFNCMSIKSSITYQEGELDTMMSNESTRSQLTLSEQTTGFVIIVGRL